MTVQPAAAPPCARGESAPPRHGAGGRQVRRDNQESAARAARCVPDPVREGARPRPRTTRRAGTGRSADPRACAPPTAHALGSADRPVPRSEEHTSELQSRQYLVCRLLLEKKKTK